MAEEQAKETKEAETPVKAEEAKETKKKDDKDAKKVVATPTSLEQAKELFFQAADFEKELKYEEALIQIACFRKCF